jgi:hypothetical protein
MSHIHTLERPKGVMRQKRPQEPPMSAASATAHEVIEGTFRVIATTDAQPARRSPNRARQVTRIVFWNTAMMVALVAVPLVF